MTQELNVFRPDYVRSKAFIQLVSVCVCVCRTLKISPDENRIIVFTRRLQMEPKILL